MKALIAALKKYNVRNYGFLLVLSAVALSVIGIFAVRSANPAAGTKQIAGVAIGFTLMVLISLIDYNRLLAFHWFFYAVNIILLLWVQFFGAELNNAKRWIDLKFTTFQPSDLTKILTVLFFAKYLTDHEREINKPITVIKALLLVAPSLILILIQPNLSTTLCIAGIFFVLLYLGGLNYKVVAVTLAVIVTSVAAFLISLTVAGPEKAASLSKFGYQMERVLAWRFPDEYATDTGLQQQNSIMAIGSGMLKGKGLNNNSFTSVKNGNFLIEADTDFIFAIIGEEMGFVGCCIVLFLLLFMVIQCVRIGMRSSNTAGRIVSGGVAAMIGIQSFINIGVATGVLPNTGLSLPFVSAGLTSLVCFYIGIGLVLNVGLQPKKH